MYKSFGLMGVAGSGKDTTAKILQDALLVHELGDFETYAFASPLKEFAIDVFKLRPSVVEDRVLKEATFTQSYDHNDFNYNFTWAMYDIITQYSEATDTAYSSVMMQIAKNLGVGDFKNLDTHIRNKYLQVLADEACTPSWLRTKLDGLLGVPGLKFKTSPRRILQKTGTEFFRNVVSQSFWTDIAPKQGVIYTDVRFANELEFVRDNGGVIIKIVNTSQQLIQNSSHASEELVYTATPDVTFTHDGVNIQSIVSEVDAFVADL